MSILSGEFNSPSDGTENTLRPKFLKDFLGQEKIKENLRIFIDAAKKRDEALDHVFLSGPPGLGKTTLAGILAHEMEVDLKITSAPALEKPKDLAGLLTTIAEKTVFFIDEVHRLRPAIEEMLYIAMEDFELDWIIGQGPSARSIRIPLPPFTMIGATTKAGQVAGPLVSRFGIPVRMNFYTPKEIEQIVLRSSAILQIEIDDTAVKLLSRCSRGTPRVANRLLRRIRDFAQIKGDGKIYGKTVEEGIGRLGIDRMGLENHDREILKTIIEKYGGGPVGADTLSISIGEEIESLEDFYEPYLIQCGFLQRTPRGRIVTPQGYAHLNISPADRKNEDQRFLF